MFIADAHLDLAYNVTRGRDPRQPAAEQPAVDNEIATVGLPDLRKGGVGLICATIFCAPGSYAGRPGYTNSDEARTQALSQLKWYREQLAAGELKLIRKRGELSDHAGDAIQTILLLEGADALRSPDDLDEWFAAGLRIVGLSWKQTRYAGGTGAPGPLTAEGKELVEHLDRFGIIHDASHLAEQSFWDLVDATERPIIASHSNCRAIVGSGDRHLTDEMIKAIVARGGVIGLNYYDKFLLPIAELGQRRARLSDLVDHAKRICDLAGSAEHVAIGTDMDGGLGREQIPQEIVTSADLNKLAPALTEAGFSETDVKNVMGANWLRFFRAQLPV